MSQPTKSLVPVSIIRALRLQPGEGKLAAIMIFYSAAISVAIMVGYRGVATGLFLSQLPPSAIPYLYILPAIAVSVAILMYNQVALRISQRALVLGSLALIFGIVLLFRVLLSTPFGHSFAVLAGLYVFMEAVFNLLTLQYWALAGQLYDPRAAKRLFGLFAVCGMIAGLISAVLLGPLGELMGVPNLLIVAALGVAAAWGYTRVLLNRYIGHSDGFKGEASEHGDTASGEAISTRQTITAIWKMPLLLAIAGLTILVALLYTMGDYVFNLALQETFGHDEQETVAYLGTFLGLASLAAIVTQFYIGPFVIKRLGLLPTLLFYPVSTGLVAIITLLVGGGLYAASGIAACIIIFRLTLYETGVHILYLPISANLRARAKELLWIAHAVASGLVGVIFLVVQAINPIPYYYWSVPLIILAALGVWLVSWTRRQYTHTLTENIRRRQFDLSASTLDVTDETTVEVIAGILRQEDELEVLQGLELIESAPDADWTPHVVPLLSHRTPEVRTQALRYLGRSENTAFLESTTGAQIMETLLNAPEEEVRAAAVEVACGMAGRRGEHTAERVAPFLVDTSLQVRASAILGLARFGGGEGLAIATDALHKLLMDPDPQARREGLLVLGDLEIRELIDTLISLLDDPMPQVRADAVHVAGKLGNPLLIQKLIPKFKDGATAAAAIEALARYGETSTQALAPLLESSSEDREVRKQIPRVLARIGGDLPAQMLLAHLSEPDEDVRAEVYRALSQLCKSLMKHRSPERREGAIQYPPIFQQAQPALLKAAMLEMQRCYALFVLREDVNADWQDPLLNEALTLRIHRALSGVFDLLSVIHAEHEMDEVRQTLGLDHPTNTHGERNDTKRTQALELLDNVADSNLRELLVPMFEASPDQIIALAKKRFSLERKSLGDRLQELVADTDQWMQALAYWRIGAEGASSNHNLQSLLVKGLESPNALVRETAETVERKLRNTKRPRTEDGRKFARRRTNPFVIHH